MKQMLLSCMILFAPIQVYAGQNLSGLSISVGTASTTTYTQVLVIDPLGRKTGFDPDLKHRIKNIPGSSYVTESIDAYDGTSKGDESAVFAMNSPIPGSYRVVLVGLGNANYSLQISAEDSKGKEILSYANIYTGSLFLGASQQYLLNYNPTPGAPAPVITKTVTFGTLRQDLVVAQKLNQIGDDKFIGSLTRMISSAERQIGICAKNKKNQGKPCKPAIAVLNMFVKRLEAANRKCDSKKSQLCDEDNDWNDFNKEHRNDHDYDDFYHDWDKDDWQKDKKKCKRFVSDEALKIISEDAQWLIKSLGGDIDKNGKEDKDQKGGGRN